MKKRPPLTHEHYLLIIALLIILFVTYRYLTKDIRMITLTTQQQQQVDELLNNTATRCMGVYLFDLPKQFISSLATELNYTDNHQIIIETDQIYLPPFKQMLAYREQELKNTQPVYANDGNFLKAIHPVPTTNPDKMQGIIFERMESTTTPDVARILEGYRWQNNVSLKIEIKARNGLANRYNQKRKDYPNRYNNNVPEKLAQMYKLFEQITVRDDYTIPTEPGFCFINGFMHGGVKEYKNLNFNFRYNSHKSFSIQIDIDDYSDDLSLLDAPDEIVMPKPGHTVYKGKRESHNLQMEEWIVKGAFFSDNNKDYPIMQEGYIFYLAINQFDANYKKPQLTFKMHYKIPTDTSIPTYNEDQLMVIWRDITDSIRIRESAFDDE